jgi:hypothetical protein
MYKASIFFVLPRNQSTKSKKDSPMVLGGREHNLAISIQQP